MHVFCVQVSVKKKHVGSTAGMQTSVDTSELLKHRAQNIVPQRMTDMKQAILTRHFHNFAQLTMKVVYHHLVMLISEISYLGLPPFPLSACILQV